MDRNAGLLFINYILYANGLIDKKTHDIMSNVIQNKK